MFFKRIISGFLSSNFSVRVVPFLFFFISSFVNVNTYLPVVTSSAFSEGFLGDIDSNNSPQDVVDIFTFSTLGISSIELSQDSDNSLFGGSANGNGNKDYDVNIIFNFSNGSSTTLSGTLSWREPPVGNIDIIGLNFANSVDFTVPNSSFRIRGGTNKNRTSLGLKVPTSSITLTDGQSIQGANSTAGILNWLNDNLSNDDTTAPVITSGTSGTDLDENSGSGQTVYTITATDAVGVSSYAIGGTDASLLTLSGTTVSLDADPDYETKSSYSFTVTASDAAGNTSSATTVTFSINDVDDTAPVITSGTSGTDLDENSGSGQTVYTITATDAVGVSSYAIGGTDASLLTLSGTTVSLDADPDYETKSSYSFTVTASDAAGNTSSATTVTFSINDVDDTAPVITSGTSGTDLDENSGSGQTVYTITATDALGVSSYAIGGTDASLLTLSGTTVSLDADPDYETKSSYSFTVTASDAAGNTSSATTVTFSINDVDDTAPVITSGTSGTDLDENSGSGQTVYTITATDAVGVSSYAIGGTDASLLTLSGTTVSLDADPDYETKSSYSFTVTASDAAGNTSSATTVTFSINDVDDTAPVITSGTSGTDLDENSGSGQTVYTITATDAVGVSSYAIGGTDASLLTLSGTTVSLDADPDYETKSSYSFTVTASDAAGNTSSATTVTFSINDVDDTAPVITSGTSGTDLDENSGSGQTVYTITATDAVGVSSYAIGGTDASLLTLSGTTVSLDADPDYETKSSYSFTVTASDAAGNTSSATTVTFSINDVDDTAPVITSGTSGTDLDENSGSGQTVYTITATDAVGVSSYAIGGTDASLLTLSGTTVSLDADPDYETKSSYSFTVTASDAAGNTSSATTVTFSINDVDDTAPVITSGTSGTDLDENSGSGQTVYTITATDAVCVSSYAIGGTDASLLTLSGTTVSLDADPDYETKSSYSFTVTASDAAGNTSSATTVTFSINDVDDTAPVITSGTSGTDLDENSGSGQTVYTITATDAVGVSSYAIGGTDASLLTLSGTTVSLDADPDYETKSSYSFTVTASDAAGNTSSATTVTFSINDVDDTAPVITSGTSGTDLDENSGSGQTVYTITATDAVGVSSYAIGGTDASLLTLSGTTVSLDADPDYETKSSYSFTVTASDAAGNTSSATTVTFSINDVDDTAPVITSGTSGTDLDENSGSGQTVYTITATDAVGVSSYAIGGTDASLLTLSGTTVSLDADPDYETKSSYSFTVTASDAAGNTSSATTVTFSINDVDDTAPVITSGTSGTDLDENSGSGQTVYTITATDAVGVSSYAIGGTDASLLTLSGTTVSLDADPYYETKSSYSFTVTASDAAGNTSSATTVTFSINDVDDTAPVITSGTSGTDLDENSGSGQTVYTITATDAVGVSSYAIGGTDASLLTLSGTTVSLDADPDYETKSSYSFTVTASDAAGNTSSATTVTFSINDVDDTAPVITSGTSGTDLDENSGSGQTVYTITATDAVGVSSYAIGGTDASLLTLSGTTVSLDADPDYETKSSYSFTVTASDAAGNTSSATTVTFSINDVDDTAPVITSGTSGTDLDENSGSGQTVYTITATDAVGVSSYAIGGTDASLLTLSGTTVSLDADPDYETKSSYSFTVTASDAAGNTSSATTVTFSINDVDDTAPVITSGTSGTYLDENSGSGQTVYTITATDAVGVSSYAIGGTDASLLTLSGTTVSLDADPDYETKSSYSFTVTASDAAGNTSSATTVTFSINDVDDTAPVITSGTSGTDLDENSGSGQTVYTITATDAVGVSQVMQSVEPMLLY